MRTSLINSCRQHGFTLIELMMAIAILGILLSIALPSFQQYLGNQAVRSASTDLYVAMNYARSEAVKRNAVVQLKAVNGDWKQGWVVVVGGDEILREFSATSGLTFETNLTTVNYDGSGRANYVGIDGVELYATWDVAGSAGTVLVHCVRISGTGKPHNRKGACS